MSLFSHEYFMKEALKESKEASSEEEVPIGAVIVCNDQVIAKAHNQTERLKDVTAHAEMIAITAASAYLGSKYLQECTIYVTVEPCPMCAAALGWAQIGQIIYGTADEKKGYSLFSKKVLHPKTKVISAIMESECTRIIKEFFAGKRNNGQQ